eukprot:jgi/Ulvmu1/5193/UM021_0210.1
MASRHGHTDRLSNPTAASLAIHQRRSCSYGLHGCSFRGVQALAGSKLNGTAVDREIDSMPARSRLSDACERGLPDVDACTIDFGQGVDDSDDIIAKSARAVGARKGGQDVTVLDEAWSRGKWLLGLLFLQSASSIILDRYQEMLRDHLVITLFLTMLVGAGGNAGNQSAIKIIRGLATGKIDNTWTAMRQNVSQQARVGIVLGSALALGGFLRVYFSNGSLVNASAISLSLVTIVMSSVCLGSLLPFVLSRAGIDPANAGTSIQVAMDVLGVMITCVTCDFVFLRFMDSL